MITSTAISILMAENARLRDQNLARAKTINAICGGAERRSYIKAVLESGVSFNSPDVARHFNCTIKTVQRDIALLRASAEMAIAFDPVKNTFHLTTKGPLK